MPGKYSPLEEHLRNLPASQKEVRLTFAQIENIIKSKLPASAQEQSWWDHATEGNHVNTRAWSNTGWRVGHGQLARRRVHFARG